MQEFVVANDRLASVIRDVIIFSTILVMKQECKEKAALKKVTVDYEKCEIPLSQVDDELVENIVEDFLEAVFGTETKMPRRQFLDKLASDENNWILDAEKVRRRVKR